MRAGWLVLFILLATACCRVAAADIDLVAAAGAARQQAEAALAAERGRIITARSGRAAELTALIRNLAIKREALAAVRSDLTRLQADLVHTQDGGALAEAQVTQQLARAVAVLQIPAPLALEQRAPAVAQALLTAPARLLVEAALRTTDELVQDRAGNTVRIPVRRIGAARALACGDSHATRGVLLRQNGMELVTGQALPPAMEARLADPGHVLLDVQGTWSSQAPPAQRSLGEWIKGGRLFIWPILAVGMVGVLLAILRTIALARVRADHRPLDAIYAWIAAGRSGPAPLCDARQPIGRVLAVGMATLGQARATREAALDRAVLTEAPQLMRGLSILLLLASIAPLLGLLGTVTGMIDLFAVIGAQGSGNARSLSGGISEALITTQAGMLVAVPLLVAHSLLNRAAERRLLLLDEAASGFLAQEPPPTPPTPPMPEIVAS